MVRLLFVVACLFFAGCSSTNSGLHNNGKFTVTGVGRTFEEAKNDGFARAVEFAVGAVILTDTQVRNDKLIKDEIVKHSAGYVDDFTILSKVVGENKVTLKMDVQVRSSKIAERVLNVSSASTRIQGQRISSQYQTFMQDRKTGDQVLNTVLQDFPSKAFNVKRGDAVFGLDKERNAYISVPFELRWNYNYLKALNEALAIVQDGKSSNKQDVIYISSKDPKSWVLGETNAYYFDDNYRFNRIQQQIRGQIIVIAVVSDNLGNKLFSACENAMHLGLHNTNPFKIFGNEVARDTVEIQINRGSPRMKDLDKANQIELTFAAGSCYNYTY